MRRSRCSPDTRNAATNADVAGLRQRIAERLGRYGRVCRHDVDRGLLVVDLDVSPLPASAAARRTAGLDGRCGSTTGRKLVRVRAATM